MFSLPFIRGRIVNPIPKKGTKEYKDLQDRLHQRKEAELNKSTAVAAPNDTKIPKFLRWMLWFSGVPGVAGAFGIIKSDYNTSEYKKYMEFSGMWIGLFSTFMGSCICGVEAMQYNLKAYEVARNKYFIGFYRILAGFAYIPLGLYFIHSVQQENWKGLTFYLLAHEALNLYQGAGATRRLMPMWVSNIQWPWSIYSGTVVLFMIYSILNKNNYNERMKIANQFSKKE
ncbi:unnamed protein product [Blepharisma stoltei]|uniref:Uncharacterized protein n=1 Tax=Blepharisma stoltei TaxID=1481888 RepID=A0AAU9J747_9CILI|nr:unnamed protein product [Blepharisma stoltei]